MLGEGVVDFKIGEAFKQTRGLVGGFPETRELIQQQHFCVM